jgi:hypothetical protein
MSRSNDRQPLGLVLLDAHLISQAQLEAALLMQTSYPDLLLGEILALRGWLKQETSDFFADRWPQLLNRSSAQPIGQYLQSAGLLNEDQIQTILQEQRESGVQFGVLAAYKGWVNQATVDFFLERLKSAPSQPVSIPLYDLHGSIEDNDRDWLDRLTQANLLSEAQLQILQGDRTLYPDMSLKEILTLRGWLRPKTLEFFQCHWGKVSPDRPLGYYLQEADLLTEQQIQDLLRDQWQTGVKLGALAVMRGWLKQETLDVFLQTLAPEKRSDSPFVSKHAPIHNHTTHQEILEADESLTEETAELKIPQDQIAYQSLDEFADAQGLPPDIWDQDDIDWII